MGETEYTTTGLESELETCTITEPEHSVVLEPGLPARCGPADFAPFGRELAQAPMASEMASVLTTTR